mgnify:CR=1 FL=1
MPVNKKWLDFLYEGNLRTAGIVLCLRKDKKFLIIRRSDIDDRAGQWTIPGGHIDESDRSIESGAVRELDEETGLLCDTRDLIYLGEPKPKKYYFLTLNWTGTININKPNPHTGKIEHDDWKWCTIEETKEIANTEFPIYLLEKALKIAGFDADE